jgi:anti-anti-sigma regulatory factor
MFRITKVFENDSMTIYRIEGKVTDENLDLWTEEIATIRKLTVRQIILDFCQVWFMSNKALEALLALMSNDLYLLNCSMEVRNALHTAGLSTRLI